MRGQDNLAGVKVATESQVRLCTDWWDYVGHCKAEGMAVGVAYDRWIDQGIIPDMRWLKWLYGTPPPDRSFVVLPDLQMIRHERSARSILRAAKLGMSATATIPPKWKTEFKEAFLEIVDAVAGGRHPESTPLWESVPSRTRNNMVEFAKGAKLSACCERAKMSLDKVKAWLSEAESRGVRVEVERYLRLDRLWTDDSEHGGKWHRFGLVAPRVYVPPPGAMKFQARANRVKNSLVNGSRYLEDVPALDQWFMAWTAPFEKKKGGKRILPETLDETSIRPVRGNTSAPPAPTVHASASEDTSSTHENGDGRTESTPRWDNERRQLWLGDRLVKSYGTQTAENQIHLLQAFQDAAQDGAWPKCIHNPFTTPGVEGRPQAVPETLSKTCANMRRSFPQGTITFHPAGDGKNAIWKLS